MSSPGLEGTSWSGAVTCREAPLEGRVVGGRADVPFVGTPHGIFHLLFKTQVGPPLLRSLGWSYPRGAVSSVFAVRPSCFLHIRTHPCPCNCVLSSLNVEFLEDKLDLPHLCLPK